MSAEERAEVARIAAIVAERVRQALAQPARESIVAAAPAGPRVLAVFTGGELALEAALRQLSELRAAGYRIDSLLSARAEQVIGRERVARVLACPLLAPEPGASMAQFLAPYQAVLVPVLTRSSAARLSVGITDTLATEAIWGTLMLGKPVVAARNAADPAADCPAVATRRAAEAVHRLLAGHLERLAEFGVRLVDAGELAAAAREALGGASPAAPAAALPRTILTGEDVLQAAAKGERCLRLGSGSQVTHVAREAAARLGVRIEVE